MNEWIDGWIDGPTSKCVNEWMNHWNKRTNERTNERNQYANLRAMIDQTDLNLLDVTIGCIVRGRFQDIYHWIFTSRQKGFLRGMSSYTWISLCAMIEKSINVFSCFGIENSQSSVPWNCHDLFLVIQNNSISAGACVPYEKVYWKVKDYSLWKLLSEMISTCARCKRAFLCKASMLLVKRKMKQFHWPNLTQGWKCWNVLNLFFKCELLFLASTAGFTHANFVGRFLKCSKQTQAKNRLKAMTSPILKNLLTSYRFWPDFCLGFAWKF